MRQLIALIQAAFTMLSCTQAAAEPEPVQPPPPQPQSVTLAAVGDNLIHDVIYQQARTDNGYDFKPAYSKIQNLIFDADIAFINQETPMHPERPPSNYPMFNTPVQMSEDLAALGFDVVNISNNHMLDMGAEGLSKTIEQIRGTQGLLLTGAWQNANEHNIIPITEKNGITFAFLGFAEYTNSGRPASAKEMLCYTDERELVLRLVGLARKQADVVVVSVHWGNENVTQPTAAQREFAEALAGLGVDVILGTHPHVLQPLERIKKAGGGETLVYYSLGNFISAQAQPQNLISGIASVTFTRELDSGKVSITANDFIPLITHYGGSYRELSLYPLSAYSDELAAQHGIRTWLGYRFDIAYIRDFLAGLTLK